MDGLECRIDQLDANQRERLRTVLVGGLSYYGSPHTWHAVSLLGLPQNDPGDILRDGSEVSNGSGESYRPGQLARAAVEAARDALGTGAPDWSKHEVPTEVLGLMELDLDAREKRMRAEAAVEQELEEQDREQQEVDAGVIHWDCGCSSSFATPVEFARPLDPRGGIDNWGDDAGEPRRVMPSACPVCESPIRGGGLSRQPYVQDYGCGSTARHCGHIIRYDAATTARCELLASLLEGAS